MNASFNAAMTVYDERNQKNPAWTNSYADSKFRADQNQWFRATFNRFMQAQKL